MNNLKVSELLAFSLSIVLLTNGCVPAAVEPTQTDTSSQSANTVEANIPLPTDVKHTMAEVEELAGFDVREPKYLPTGVSLDYATYQKSPSPYVTLQFKIVHETYGDMGAFFQIVQEAQEVAPPDTISCGQAADGCEVISIDDIPVVYRLNPGGTEGMDWFADGFSFHLLRTAGEPNKVYKDELVSVVASMK